MQKRYFNYIFAVYNTVLNKLREGVRLSDVYQAALKKVAGFDQKLVKHFTKNCGFATGIEFCESSLMLASDSQVIARQNMFFAVMIGFTNLPHSESTRFIIKNSTPYSLFIGNTVIIDEPQLPASQLPTENLKNIYFFSTLEKGDSSKNSSKHLTANKEAKYGNNYNLVGVSNKKQAYYQVGWLSGCGLHRLGGA